MKIPITLYVNIYSHDVVCPHATKDLAKISANEECTYVAVPVVGHIELPNNDQIIDAEWVELNERIDNNTA